MGNDMPESSRRETRLWAPLASARGAFEHSGKSIRNTVDSNTQRRSIRKAMYLALWIWPAFTLLDVYMAVFLYPEAPIWHFIVMRVGAQVLIVVVYWMSLQRDIPLTIMLAAVNLVHFVAAVFITFMAFDFGGLNSPYVHGVSIVMLIRSVTVATSWRSTLRVLTPLALTFPVIMGISSIFPGAARTGLIDSHSILQFISNYAFVLSLVAIGALLSHVVFAAQQQVFHARKLGRYRLKAPIGEGGMHQVWLAWDETLRRDVALKILQAGDTPNQSTVQRFEREARSASKLTNPHTIRIFDLGASDDGIYFIAMEYLRGADLAALVRGHGAMPIPRALHFVMQACESVTEAHEAGIIHRDIKPQNLFVTHIGEDYDFLKLLDFGIARLITTEDDASVTRTGVIRGTPAFLAPEVCRGERADARSDLYALGATLYFLLTGSPPFEGPSTAHVLVAHVLHAPVPPSIRRGEPIPQALEKIVLRCLAKDPNERFQTVNELADALSRVMDAHEWTAEDARRFWQVDRVAKLEHWEAPTEETLANSTAGAVAALYSS